MRSREALVLPLVCTALTAVLLGPVLLRRGFVLEYDMVFTPTQPLLPDSVGLGSALPRAVPADAVIALLTMVVPGDLIQKAVLAGAVFAAALGAGRLVPTGGVVAAVTYAWSAYVAERLFIGHWAVLVGYACLPWVVAAGLRLRRGEPRAWAGLVLASAPAVLVPTGGLLVAGAAVAAAGLRRAPLALTVSLVLNAPWWVPAIAHPARATADPGAVDVFRARAEGPGGALVSVLGLGGSWNAQTVPASRHGVVVLVAALALVAGVVVGVPRLAAVWGRAPAFALTGLGLVGLALAVAGNVPGVAGGLRWLVTYVPGAGLLRDGQKWAAWWALLAAPAGALAARAAADWFAGKADWFVGKRPAAGQRAEGGAVRSAVLVAAALLPLILLPDLGWGGLGRLAPVRYPPDWTAVRGILAADPRPGDVLVLPFQPYRRFGWNGNRPQLDPAPRFLPRSSVVDDTLRVGGRDVRGEDPRAAAAGAAIGDWPAQARLGIGWVLVEHGTPGRIDPAALAGLDEVHSGPWLTLYRIPGEITTRPVPNPVAVLLADAAALALIVAALLRRWLPTGTLMHAVCHDREGGARAHHRWRCVCRPHRSRPRGRALAGDRHGQRAGQGGVHDDQES